MQQQTMQEQKTATMERCKETLIVNRFQLIKLLGKGCGLDNACRKSKNQVVSDPIVVVVVVFVVLCQYCEFTKKFWRSAFMYVVANTH